MLTNIDWISILLYTILVLMGWLNIYAATYDESHSSILDFSQRYGKQLVWIAAAFGIGFIILLTDSKFFTAFSMIIYGGMILLLVLVLVLVWVVLLEVVLKVFLVTLALQVLFSTTYLLVLLLSSLSLFMV